MKFFGKAKRKLLKLLTKVTSKPRRLLYTILATIALGALSAVLIGLSNPFMLIIASIAVAVEAFLAWNFFDDVDEAHDKRKDKSNESEGSDESVDSEKGAKKASELDLARQFIEEANNKGAENDLFKGIFEDETKEKAKSAEL